MKYQTIALRWRGQGLVPDELSICRLVRLRLMFCLAAFFYATFSHAYSTKNPQLRIEVGQHTGMINRMAINQAATILATASDDKTLRLWNLPEGTAYATLRVPIGENLQGALYAVALAPDGKTVITAGETGNATDKFSLYVFDVDKRVLKARIADMPSAIYHLTYSKKGDVFAAALAGGFGIKIWDSQTGQLIAQDTDYGERSTWMAFNDAGQLATVSHDGYLRLYDPQFKLIKKIALAKSGIPYSINYSPDQTKLAIGYSNLPRVDIFDNQLNSLHSLEITQLHAPNAAIVAWQTDKGLAVSGNMQNAEGDYVIRQWSNIQDPAHYQDIPVSQNIITDLVGLPDSSQTKVDMLFASANPSWGGLKNSQIVYKNQAAAWDARVVELPKKTFQLSFDGLKVAYAVDPKTAQFNLLDLTTLEISTHNSTDALAGLNPPTAQHEKFNFSNWQRSAAPMVNGKAIKLDNFEQSLSMAIDLNTYQAFLGSNFHLRLVDAQGKTLKK